LAKEFEKQGYEVHLFSIGKTTQKDSRYIHIINSNKKSVQLKFFKKKFQLENEIKEFDLVIANNLRTHYLLSKINIKNDLYVFHQGRLLQNVNLYVKLRRKIMYSQIYKNKRLIAVSKCLMLGMKKNFYYLKYKKFDYIYNGFDKNLILQKSNELKVEDNYIVGIGRLEKNKNFEYLIKSFSKITNKKIKLYLVGDGEDKYFLKDLVEKLNIANRVKFIGWVDNPYPYIKNAKLLVHPSKIEAMPTVLIESLILHTPVVATDIKCGPNEILIDKLSQFLVPLNDMKKLTELIDKALKNYPTIEEKYINKFLISNVIKKYKEYIK